MNAAEAKRYLERLATRFRLTRLGEIVLVALGLGLLVFALTRLLWPDYRVAGLSGGAVFVTVLVLRIRRTGALRWNALNVSLYMNAKFPDLKDSADLLVSARQTSSLEEVQRMRVLEELQQLKLKVRPPHRLGQSVVVLLAGVLAVWFLPAATFTRKLSREIPTSVDSVMRKTDAPSLKKIEIHVDPPSYTRVRSFTVPDGAFKVPAGSRLRWNISFEGEPVNPSLIFAGGDSLSLTRNKAAFQLNWRVKEPSFYQVTWRDASGKRFTSDFFHADIREDAVPAIAVTDRLQFQVVKPGEPLQMTVNVKASDDYGLTDAHLVATVSKGSGEAVKFREVVISFEGARFPSKEVSLRRSMDLAQLGLEPGDELYFYAEAIDNRVPAPNLARTETFFIALQDTAEAVAVADAGLGVDLMPDYFRSQRQLIIDTEKLLAEQKKIKRSEFNSRSNELGFDQKALRLKYGQFLGMEDEAGIGVVEPTVDERKDEEEDPMKKFGHQHDKENEHNLVDEKKTAKPAGHEHEEHAEGTEQDPLKAFIHQHDSEDEATFFIQSVRAKLSAALTLMWDSELHLRMYEPKKSLPYQYRILALLKEIAQDNRAFVHRTGFDPPPIKEERRLTGELDEASGTIERTAADQEARFPAIRSALAVAEEMIQRQEIALSPSARSAMQQAGYEVAAEAIKQPGRYLMTLSALKKLAGGEVDKEDARKVLLSVRRDLWSLLPRETYDPSRPTHTLHALDRDMLQLMENSRE